MTDPVDVTKPLWFSGSQLAKLLGISVQRIDQLQAEGTLVKVEKKYDLHVNMPLYVERLRKQAAGRMGSADDGEDKLDPVYEAARLKKEQADAVALKNEVARANLVPRDAIEKAMGAVVLATRSRFGTLRDRLPLQLNGLSKREKQIVRDDVQRTLDQFAIDSAKALKQLRNTAEDFDDS